MAAWTGWDGRRLSWRDGGAAQLCVDGVPFAPVGPDTREYDFALAPSGNAEVEFSLRGVDGAEVLPAWRVRHGAAAEVGRDQWQGDVPGLRALPPPPRLAQAPARVSIVVPIYNSQQCVQRCIASVLRWTAAPARLILIDDCSTEAGISELLARHADEAHVLARRNERNLGYTRSANRGIELAGADDVVLLNSDTEVGPRWLETLRDAAYAASDVGTATAVSDNAGAFTVPELEHYCPIPERWTLTQTQRALLQHAGGIRPELPTGNGFCMYVKRALIGRIGMLDAEAFPAGYGEENDLCQRAERAGYRHVIAGDVFVRHARSASFGAERRVALGAQGMAVLRARYPDYEAKVGATLFGFARRVLDYRVRRVYADRDGFFATHAPRPRVLLAGGARALASTLAAHFDCYLSDPNRRELRSAERPGDARSGEDLGALLRGAAIELVHLHGADARLARAAHDAGIPAVDTTDGPALLAQDPIPTAARCERLYRDAWLHRAAFPRFCDGDWS